MVNFCISSLFMSNLDFIGVGINSLVLPKLFVAKIYRPTCVLILILIQLPIVRYYIIRYPWFQDAPRPRGSRSSTNLEVKIINSKPFQRNLAHMLIVPNISHRWYIHPTSVNSSFSLHAEVWMNKPIDNVSNARYRSHRCQLQQNFSTTSILTQMPSSRDWQMQSQFLRKSSIFILKIKRLTLDSICTG